MIEAVKPIEQDIRYEEKSNGLQPQRHFGERAKADVVELDQRIGAVDVEQ